MYSWISLIVKTNLSSVERKEKKLTYDIQSLQEENVSIFTCTSLPILKGKCTCIMCKLLHLFSLFQVHLKQQLTCPQPHPPTSQGEVDSLQRMLDELKLEVTQERRVNSDLRSKCDQLASEASSAKVNSYLTLISSQPTLSLSLSLIQSRGDYDISKLQRENAQLKTKVSQQEHTLQEYKSDLELITEEASSEHNDVRVSCIQL